MLEANGNLALGRSDALAMERSVQRFLKTPQVVAAKSAKRHAFILRWEESTLQQALPEWLVRVESGTVRRPSTIGSKRQFEKACWDFKAQLRLFRDKGH